MFYRTKKRKSFDTFTPAKRQSSYSSRNGSRSEIITWRSRQRESGRDSRIKGTAISSGRRPAISSNNSNSVGSRNYRSNKNGPPKQSFHFWKYKSYYAKGHDKFPNVLRIGQKKVLVPGLKCNYYHHLGYCTQGDHCPYEHGQNCIVLRDLRSLAILLFSYRMLPPSLREQDKASMEKERCVFDSIRGIYFDESRGEYVDVGGRSLSAKDQQAVSEICRQTIRRIERMLRDLKELHDNQFQQQQNQQEEERDYSYMGDTESCHSYKGGNYAQETSATLDNLISNSSFMAFQDELLFVELEEDDRKLEKLQSYLN